ncbi:hypothetical protein LDC_1409 [sediment metagenome]|uniref:Uncharacterized protein n=1 Tax=sediment metagenome TaxID=749907 RepID=D9PIQ1_9ZZZZ
MLANPPNRPSRESWKPAFNTMKDLYYGEARIRWGHVGIPFLWGFGRQRLEYFMLHADNAAKTFNQAFPEMFVREDSDTGATKRIAPPINQYLIIEEPFSCLREFLKCPKVLADFEGLLIARYHIGLWRPENNDHEHGI